MPAKKNDLTTRLARARKMLKKHSLTIAEAATEEDLRPSTLHRYCVDRGDHLPRPGWTRSIQPNEGARILALRKKGWTNAEIASDVGFSKSTISRYCASNGAARRATVTEAPGRVTRIYRKGKLWKKWCPGCKGMVKAGHWAKRTSAKDGLQGYCKSCNAKQRSAKRAA